MIKNPKLRHFGKKKKDDKPSFYKESALFPGTHPATPGSKYAKKGVEIPDPDLEPLEPADDDMSPTPSGTAKATETLQGVSKATPAKPDLTGKLEGKFKVSVTEMIKQLNKIISAEYSEWMRWYHYALVLRGHCRDALAEEFEGHAEEELGHASTIALRVIALGGYPTTSMDHPVPLKKTEEILQELIYREQEGIKLYRDVLELCGENEGTRQLLEGNIAVEQDHVDELWRYLKHPEVVKANMSSGEWDSKPEKQSTAAYSHSFARDTQGISGASSPDLPDRGRDWHGTVPGVPDEPQATSEEDEEEQKEAQDYFKPPPNPMAPTKTPQTQEAKKALAGAPQFMEGPVMAPRAVSFLLEQGFSPEEIQAGRANMTANMRGLYNRNLTSSVRKSISTLKGR